MTLTTEGFERPRLIEIKSGYDKTFTDALGPINTAPDSVIGQTIAIFSAAIDDAYEMLQNTYDAMYPSTAEGTSLDGAVSFVGLERLAASPTSVVAMCYGTESTLIPTGALVRSLANRQFVATADTVISRSSAGDATIEVVTVTNSANYQIIAGGVSVVYTADSSTSAAEIAAGLAALFDSDVFLATADGGSLRLRSADLYSDFTLTVDSKLSITLLGTPVVFTALDLGAYELPANSLTRLDTSILGWDTVNNLIAGATGRFVESDAELRLRHEDTKRATGSATLQAIRAKLLAEVDGVTKVSIYENRINAVDAYLLPSHSFETVVSGGLDQAVADKLFAVKPAGIQTYGNTSIDVYDENGDLQVCKFSRASSKYAWVRVSVDSLNTEETLTTQISEAIKDAVLEFAATIGIGGDLIAQRFFGPIYKATTGIGSMTIEIAVTALPGDLPSYSTSNISMGRAENAVFDAARIVVVGV